MTFSSLMFFLDMYIAHFGDREFVVMHSVCHIIFASKGSFHRIADQFCARVASTIATLPRWIYIPNRTLGTLQLVAPTASLVSLATRSAK
jgi:hypothetical protein